MKKKGTQITLLHYLRRMTQLAVVVAAGVTGYRYAAGLSLTTVEKYCPMGGAATGYSVAAEQRFSCATGEVNLSLILALLVLAVVARKAFCSWLCPVGTVSEWLGALVGKIRGSKSRRRSGTDLALYRPAESVNSKLRLLRYVVLGLILYATIISGELLFRPYCPYYVMFSLHGHDVEMWSYAVLAVVVAGMILVPMLWCRYLCPLGGLLSPFSRPALLKIARTPDKCVDCGACDRACGHSLPVATSEAVTSSECTLCLSCLRSCPAAGALSLSAGKKWALPAVVVPLALVAFLGAGLVGGTLYTVPSYARDYQAASQSPQDLRQATFIVRGVRCVDTAILAATVFEEVEGVRRFVSYASRNEVMVEYDAALIDEKLLVQLIDGPVYMEAEDEFVFDVFEVLETKGE